MSSSSVFRRLARDSGGQAMLETAIVLPVILVLSLLIMEAALIFNAKQMANYAAFCAARTASVYGTGDEAKEKIHFSAAIAMTPVSPGILADAATIAAAFGLDPGAIPAIKGPGGLGNEILNLLERLADSYIRTYKTEVSVGGPDEGKKHKYVNVDVTYIYRCRIFPLGLFFGKYELVNKYAPYIQASEPYQQNQAVRDAVDRLIAIAGLLKWNVPIHGGAMMDYWAD